MKLYQTFPGHFVSYSVQITAAVSGLAVENVFVAPESELAQNAEFKAKKAHWNFPVLETADGKVLSESVALCRFIALEAGRHDLIGNTPFEQAQIDQFCSIAQSGIWKHARDAAITTFGHVVDPAVNANAVKELKDQLKNLNNALNGKDYFVGNRFTIADAALFAVLLLPFTLVLDAGFRKAMPNVSAWFERVSKLPEVIKVAGHVKLPAKGLKPVSK